MNNEDNEGLQKVFEYLESIEKIHQLNEFIKKLETLEYTKIKDTLSKVPPNKIKEALDNPQMKQQLNQLGINQDNLVDKALFLLQPEKLKKLLEGFKGAKFSKILELKDNPNFKQWFGFANKLKKQENITEADLNKFNELGNLALKKEVETTQNQCFINDHTCNHIIKAHSIQENGELSKLSKHLQNSQRVFQFVKQASENNKLEAINITTASIFLGFCKYHDNLLFEPLDKKTYTSHQERNFLYSLRSFAYSYTSLQTYQNYLLNLCNDTFGNIEELVAGFKEFLPDNLPFFELSNISIQQKEVQKIQRFEKYKYFLINYLQTKHYNELDFISYEVNHLCPIACSSWVVAHIIAGNGFIMMQNDNNKPYYGYPILLSILPTENNKTIIVLGRFKFDRETELIFNPLNNLLQNNKQDFELAISKMIIEKTQNFYLAPDFWEKLSQEEKETVLNGVNIPKTSFPKSQTQFDMINFFDKKYSIIP